MIEGWNLLKKMVPDYLKNNCHTLMILSFADAFPGKYELLDETLNLLKTGGSLYIVDDIFTSTRLAC